MRPVDEANKRIEQKSIAEKRTTTKIIGGNPAPADKFPFQVALISSSTPPGMEHFGQFCGGSLIKADVVLTAAHCVPNTSASEVDIILGTNILASDGQFSGIRMNLADIEDHEDYDPNTNDNDIALLHVAGPIPETVRTMRTATVATPALDQRYAFTGGDAVVVGWGLTQEGGGTTPVLMRVWLDVQSNDLCEDNYQAQFPSISITDNMLCAGVTGGGMDSCQGDSGGFLGAPLGDAEYVQLGVVSWGIGCARPDLFGVYTRVGNYAEWIEDTIGNF